MTDTPPPPAAAVTPVTIEEEMRRSYLDYAMSVIVARALPDVRDGLKPVQRRILYAMKENGYTSDKPFRKSARIVGDVMGSYHPHGNDAIYDAMVRMAQDFSMRLPLIQGQGNFGSMDGDPPAAMRYTEARLAKAAEALLEDIGRETVDFQPNYDDTTKEPTVLPAEWPNLLVNGAGGIAVGMATNMPPHNLGEVIDACLAYVDDPDISVDGLIEQILGPDFPTGGVILGRAVIRQAYHSGRGSIVMRGRAEIEELARGREAIVITEVPYQVNKARMQERIGELVHEKTIEGISELRDESDRHGVRVVVELKRDAMADVVLNQLYRYTPLQSSFGVNMLALVDGRPELMGLKDIVAAFVKFREEVITRRTIYELGKARERAHILIGLALAVVNLDPVIAAIRKAKDPAEARVALTAKPWPVKDLAPLIALVDEPGRGVVDGAYQLSEEQAKAILDLRLHRLTGLERDRIAGELREVVEQITGYLAILASHDMLLDVLKKELLAVRERFATPRRTEIQELEFEQDVEDLIQREDMVVTVTHAGYVKRVPLSAYRAQRRGGKGRAGMATREEDLVSRLFVANTHTPVLFFSSRGMVYKMKVYRLPAGTPQARGKALVNLLPLSQGETITTLMPLPEDEASWAELERHVRDRERPRAAQQALRLRRREGERQDRHEARGGRPPHRRAAGDRARRRAARLGARQVHPLPGRGAARLRRPRLDRRARHLARQGRRGDLHVDPAPRRVRHRGARRLPAPRGAAAARGGERRGECRGGRGGAGGLSLGGALRRARGGRGVHPHGFLGRLRQAQLGLRVPRHRARRQGHRGDRPRARGVGGAHRRLSRDALRPDHAGDRRGAVDPLPGP